MNLSGAAKKYILKTHNRYNYKNYEKKIVSVSTLQELGSQMMEL